MEVNSLPIHEQSYYWRSLFATIGPRVVGVAVAGLGAGFIGRRCGIEPLYATLIGGGVGSLAALTLDLHKGGRLEAIRRIAEAKRSKAHYLNLSDLGLTSLPAEIGDLTEIRTLILRNNALRELPASMGKLTQLEWLDLGHNSLTALPTFVCQLSQLQYLILEYNQLRKVPGEIGQLLQLECLFLNSNRIEELPIAFGQLARLQSLLLDHNRLTALPQTFGQLVRLKALNLTHNRLRELPAEISNFSQLQRFILNGNLLTRLPGTVGHLSQLQDLEVCCNQLTDLPEEIGELSQLRSLALDCNQITRLPEAIGQLSQLRSLFLTGNQLTQLPQTIGRLSDLRILELNRNLHLVTLPMSLQHLRHLTYLSTEETQIPQEMGEAILAAARGYRGAEAEEAVVDRLAMWNGYSEQSLDCDTLLQSLTGPEKRSLNEWLVRLEQTKEFENRQRPLAMMVCKILASVSSNGEFRESFFAQVNGNLEECADRAAMAFNEIYTTWRCQNPDDGLSLVQGIELYARLAKTLTLRTILQEVCAGRDDLGQSVHIFLEWEVRLRDHLGLITAVQEVRYCGIGIRDWLDEEWIVQEVNKRYQRTLDRLDGFHSYLQRGDPDFRSRYAQLFDHNLSTLEKLDRSEMNEQAAREAKDAVMRQFDAEVAQLTRVCRRAICHPPLHHKRVVTVARNARPSRSP